MRILLVTTVRPSPRLIVQARGAIGLPDLTFDLISLDPATEPLAVSRHLVVDRSVVPWRPLSRASTEDTDAARPRGARRIVRAALRRGRTLSAKLPLPERWRASPSLMLASACRTSRVARSWAADADVVVAMDDPSCWSVWELSRTTDRPVFVNRPGNVQQVLSATRESGS